MHYLVRPLRRLPEADVLPLSTWRLDPWNTIDGTQAGFVRIPYADQSVRDPPGMVMKEALVMLSDILSPRLADTTPLVLAANGGSSSIKNALFTLDAEPRQVCQGSVAASVRQPRLTASSTRATPTWSRACSPASHRVVHGGARFDRARMVTTETLASLRALVPLAPNHLPMRSRSSRPASAPGAFHRDIPPVSRTLPVPETPDTLVFSGGIGEHAPVVRSRICRELSFLGVELLEEQNAIDARLISRPATRVHVRVIPPTRR